jgi:hypothetical protein
LLRLALNFRIISNKIPDEIQDAFTGVAKALQIYQNSTGFFARPCRFWQTPPSLGKYLF